jgi:hypothetical protein
LAKALLKMRPAQLNAYTAGPSVPAALDRNVQLLTSPMDATCMFARPKSVCCLLKYVAQQPGGVLLQPRDAAERLPAGHLKQATAAQRAIVVAEEDVGNVAIGAAAEQAPALHPGEPPESGMSATLGALVRLIPCDQQAASAFKAEKG